MTRHSLETKIGAATLRNPVLLASGPAGYGLEYEGMIDLVRIGGVVTKTISFEPREGNPGTRLHETGGGLLNSIGLENVGAEVFFSGKMPALVEAGIMPVVSLAAERGSPPNARPEGGAGRPCSAQQAWTHFMQPRQRETSCSMAFISQLPRCCRAGPRPPGLPPLARAARRGHRRAGRRERGRRVPASWSGRAQRGGCPPSRG